MDTPAFRFETHMLREDYRKFLYIATFFRDPVVFPATLVMCVVGAWLGGQQLGRTDPLYLVMLWLGIVVLVVILMCLNIERKNRRREAAARRTGALDRRMVFSFFDDRMLLENPAREARSEVRYEQLRRLMETKDYFVFFLNANQITMLCKRDVADPEALTLYLQPRFDRRYRKISL